MGALRVVQGECGGYSPAPSAGCATQEVTMITNEETSAGGHKFKIGDLLRFQGRIRFSGSPNAIYRVVGYRPPEGGEPSYRIKSDLEHHERIARESELA
jgi:hypothetical protein